MSGSEISPVIVLTLNFISGTRGDWTGFKWCWVWLLGELIGTIFATKVYDLYFEPTIKRVRERRREEDTSYLHRSRSVSEEMSSEP